MNQKVVVATRDYPALCVIKGQVDNSGENSVVHAKWPGDIAFTTFHLLFLSQNQQNLFKKEVETGSECEILGEMRVDDDFYNYVTVNHWSKL